MTPFTTSQLLSETSFSLPLILVPKGGWEPSDVELEAAASREALEEGPNLYSFSVSSCPDYGLSYSLLPFYHPFPL